MALVELVTEGSLATVTLNDPDRLNAMGDEMASAFRGVVEQLRPQANTTRVIILTGAGRAFSAGGNLDMLERKQHTPGEQNRQLMMEFYHSFLGILALNVPLIAAINGHAIGAGLCLASACDIRIAAKGAKLGFTFTKLGLHPGMGATYFLPRAIGNAAANELMLTARIIEAEEALSLGLVGKVVAPESILKEARLCAAEIMQCGPDSVRQLVESLRSGTTSLAAALEREALSQAINYAGAEFREGVRATIEKRKPAFTVTPNS